jgi:hypothetical protein
MCDTHYLVKCKINLHYYKSESGSEGGQWMEGSTEEASTVPVTSFLDLCDGYMLLIH